MEHPFAPDLSDKTLEELQTGLSNLTTKLTFAYRTGNGPLISQLQMMMESYRNQYSKKMDDLFAKQKLNSKINIQSADNEQYKN